MSRKFGRKFCGKGKKSVKNGNRRRKILCGWFGWLVKNENLRFFFRKKKEKPSSWKFCTYVNMKFWKNNVEKQEIPRKSFVKIKKKVYFDGWEEWRGDDGWYEVLCARKYCLVFWIKMRKKKKWNERETWKFQGQ